MSNKATAVDTEQTTIEAFETTEDLADAARDGRVDEGDEISVDYVGNDGEKRSESGEIVDVEVVEAGEERGKGSRTWTVETGFLRVTYAVSGKNTHTLAVDLDGEDVPKIKTEVGGNSPATSRKVGDVVGMEVRRDVRVETDGGAVVEDGGEEIEVDHFEADEDDSEARKATLEAFREVVDTLDLTYAGDVEKGSDALEAGEKMYLPGSTETSTSILLMAPEDEIEDLVDTFVRVAEGLAPRVAESVDGVNSYGRLREVQVNHPVDYSLDEERVLRAAGDVSVEEAREDPNLVVRDLPRDMVDEHLTTTFTPARYAKICRDVAYFTDRVGSAPKKSDGRSTASPGSGMRRSREGALYGLPHREAILSRAVDMGLVVATNEDGLDAREGEFRFEITPRGEWFLDQYYGPHAPVRRVRMRKVGRNSAAPNLSKIVVDAEEAEGAKSDESYRSMMKAAKKGAGVDAGTYLTEHGVIDSPRHVADPQREDLVGWVDPASVPTEFDLTALDGDVRVLVDLQRLLEAEGSSARLAVVLDDDGNLVVNGPSGERAVEVAESTGGQNPRLGFRGSFEAFVESGAKDALLDAVDADYAADYETWYVNAEDGLAAVEAILSDSEVNVVTIPVGVFVEFSQ